MGGAYSEAYTYGTIGTMLTKAGVTYNYPSGGSPQPHAPSSVGGNTYLYDANGSLTSAEQWSYEWDVENRLSRTLDRRGKQRKAFAYDSNGVLRVLKDGSSNPIRRYIASDYQVDMATSEGVVYYRFGGRAVAWSKGSTLRYLLADQRSSVEAESTNRLPRPRAGTDRMALKGNGRAAEHG